MKQFTTFFFLFMLILVACGKEDDPEDHSDIPLVFESLTCGRELIFTEDTTRLEAIATGYEIEFFWEVEKGDLLGSGSVITYVATPCTVGENYIYCTIKDGNGNEETKHVVVTVL